MFPPCLPFALAQCSVPHTGAPDPPSTAVGTCHVAGHRPAFIVRAPPPGLSSPGPSRHHALLPSRPPLLTPSCPHGFRPSRPPSLTSFLHALRLSRPPSLTPSVSHGLLPSRPPSPTVRERASCTAPRPPFWPDTWMPLPHALVCLLPGALVLVLIRQLCICLLTRKEKNCGGLFSSFSLFSLYFFLAGKREYVCCIFIPVFF